MCLILVSFTPLNCHLRLWGNLDRNNTMKQHSMNVIGHWFSDWSWICICSPLGQPNAASDWFPLRLKPFMGYLLASSVPLSFCFLSFLSIVFIKTFLLFSGSFLNISLFLVWSDNQLLFFLTEKVIKHKLVILWSFFFTFTMYLH